MGSRVESHSSSGQGTKSYPEISPRSGGPGSWPRRVPDDQREVLRAGEASRPPHPPNPGSQAGGRLRAGEGDPAKQREPPSARWTRPNPGRGRHPRLRPLAVGAEWLGRPRRVGRVPRAPWAREAARLPTPFRPLFPTVWTAHFVGPGCPALAPVWARLGVPESEIPLERFHAEAS